MGIRRKVAAIGFLVFFAAAAVAIAAFVEDQDQQYNAFSKENYLSAQDSSYIRPGLKFTILDLAIPADRKPLVTIKIADSMDQPLDRSGILTPGTVSTSFILAYLPPKSSTTPSPQYVSYTTRAQTSPITGVKAIQAGADSGGTWTPVGNGVYTYKFNTALPADFNTAITHTLGFYGARNLTAFGLSTYRADGTKNFVPNGSAVSQTRQLALDSSCNQCHDPLSAHGETGRKSVEVCILCHTPQTVDPDTGQPQDMKVLIHKIHRGSSLPSVIAGKPYIIIGNAQSVNDFSTVAFPQDIRNCDTCHKNSAQPDAWKAGPSAEACGSCHDDLNFVTGVNHPGGPQDNSQCANCHRSTLGKEWDASVPGAHTVPYKSAQLQFPKLSVVSIKNTAPGQFPIVTFKLTDKNGKAMDPALLTGTAGALSARIIGPSTDITSASVSQTITNASYTNGIATYTFTSAVPATATGSWAMEFEGRLNATLIKNGDPNSTIAQRDAIDTVVQYFAVTDKTATPRRTTVATANCNKCHEKLGSTFHNFARNQAEACPICHYPSRVSGTGATAESVSYQWMVHKIHTGESLSGDYVIGGTSFKEVRYPGDRRDCLQCHVGTSYQIPLPKTNVAVMTPQNLWSPTMPIAAACLGCHDTLEAATHALLNTTIIQTKQIESCAVCHKESAEFAVSASHAR
jgi:OmcA/MtrC family decaheme c-type cytochrome